MRLWDTGRTFNGMPIIIDFDAMRYPGIQLYPAEWDLRPHYIDPLTEDADA